MNLFLLKNMVDTHQLDGLQLLCVPGFRGVIKVIDTLQQMLYMSLSGHGADIYDSKLSSTDYSLCISASKRMNVSDCGMSRVEPVWESLPDIRSS
jgi:hypothetical protein